MGLIERKPTDAKLGRSDNPAVWNPPEPERGADDVPYGEPEVERLRRQLKGAVEDAAMGRALIDRMFELPRGPEWEQALAEVRVWSMKDHNPRGQ